MFLQLYSVSDIAFLQTKKESSQSIDKYIYSTEFELHPSQITPLKQTFVSSKGQTLKLVNSDDEDETTSNDDADDRESLEEQHIPDNKSINRRSESLTEDTITQNKEKNANQEEDSKLDARLAFNESIIDSDEEQQPEIYSAPLQEKASVTQGKYLLIRPKTSSIKFFTSYK